MSNIVCPACKAYLGLAGAAAANCPRCDAPLPAAGQVAGDGKRRAGVGHDDSAGHDVSPAMIERGRAIVIIVCVIVVLLQLIVVGMTPADRLSGADSASFFVTAWLLLKLWRGSGWARWFMAGVCFLWAVACILMMSIRPGGGEHVPVVMAGMGSVSLAMGFGLASASVEAFQTAQRSAKS